MFCHNLEWKIIWKMVTDVHPKLIQHCKLTMWSTCLVIPALWDPTDCSPTDRSVHGTLQARILGWVAIPFSKGSSWPRDGNRFSCIAGGFFTVWAPREALTALQSNYTSFLKWLKKKKQPLTCTGLNASNHWIPPSCNHHRVAKLSDHFSVLIFLT